MTATATVLLLLLLLSLSLLLLLLIMTHEDYVSSGFCRISTVPFGCAKIPNLGCVVLHFATTASTTTTRLALVRRPIWSMGGTLTKGLEKAGPVTSVRHLKDDRVHWVLPKHATNTVDSF